MTTTGSFERMGAARGYLLGLMLLLLPAYGAAQSMDAKSSWYISMFGGRSARILGTQDIRTNFGVGIAWQKPEPHFKWRHGPAQLVQEVYYEHSQGEIDARGRVTEAVGFIWYARFRFPTRGFHLFLDIGEGVQIASRESYDLGTRINSSPMVGFGFSIRQGSRETLVGLRMLHLSNAGVNSRNHGQNQVQVYVAARF